MLREIDFCRKRLSNHAVERRHSGDNKAGRAFRRAGKRTGFQFWKPVRRGDPNRIQTSFCLTIFSLQRAQYKIRNIFLKGGERGGMDIHHMPGLIIFKSYITPDFLFQP